jgi:uncharacterized protein YqgC (DUF456 family)
MILEVVVLMLLLLVNALGVVAVLFQLPGTWVIVAATALAGWILRDQAVFGWWTIGILLGLALIGEIVETLSGAVGSRRWGGSRRGALFSIPTAIAGATVGAAIAGSLALPLVWLVPAWLAIVLAGGAVGAAGGAVLGDRLVGRSSLEARRAGFGAAVGRLGGTVAKVLVAAVMWGTVVAAIFL